MKIEVNPLDVTSIDRAIGKLEDYAKSLDRKADELCMKLASMGATNVSLGFSRLLYVGDADVSVSVEKTGENEYSIIASGETVLIAEFGAGVKYGGGHPLNAEFGTGPGTYPGQKNAMNPNGWWLPREKTGGTPTKSYGNAPTMAMYNTGKDLRKEILAVAKEVFQT